MSYFSKLLVLASAVWNGGGVISFNCEPPFSVEMQNRKHACVCFQGQLVCQREEREEAELLLNSPLDNSYSLRWLEIREQREAKNFISIDVLLC